LAGGGGGGALGGAIFGDSANVHVRNSTFFNNYVTRGVAGGTSAANGADAGGAIFSLEGTLAIENSTFSRNQSTGSGAAIVFYHKEPTSGEVHGYPPPSFLLNNSIIANNGANECFYTDSLSNLKGSGNLIMDNGAGTFFPCPGVVTTSDPQLLPLQLNTPGNTPTMAILSASPAVNKAYPGTSLPTDQRGVARPQAGGFDIGAFEGGG
jgi:hypothetical protein